MAHPETSDRPNVQMPIRSWLAHMGGTLMECGDPQQAHPTGRFCPRCESTAMQRYRWKPDLDPLLHRRRCYVCEWDSGWVAYDRWIVKRGGLKTGRALLAR